MLPLPWGKTNILPEMAEIVSGLVFPNGNASELAEAIGQLWEDPESARSRGESGRRAVSEYFDKDSHMRALENIYEEVRRLS